VSPPRPALEPDGAQLRRWLAEVGQKLGPFLDGLPQTPASHLAGSQKLAREAMGPAPEDGVPLRRLLSWVVDRAAPVALNTAHPGYLGFIPGGGLPQSALADLISGVINRYTGLWMPAPGLVQLEIQVIRWLCTEVGYPQDDVCGGILTSGGSLANLGALVAARHHHCGEHFGEAVVFVSEQTHHSVAKAARVAGLRRDQLRSVACGPDFALDVESLARAISEERATGRQPIMVVASAGSTATGAVDPLDALARLCADEGLWLHVDGAYGGCFALTERGQARLAGLERADSITLDPHKGLFLPYGTGALLVRDRARLQAAFSSSASYLPDDSVHPDHWDFAALGPELSRPPRGLRLWLPIRMHGMGAFRKELDEKLDLAHQAFTRVCALPHVVVVTAPALSLFTVRVVPPGWPSDDQDALQRRILRNVNQRGRVFLTGAEVGPAGQRRFVIRVCVLSFRTHQPQIDALIEDLALAIAEQLPS
jgi:aromatic-L-amino-acid decarboxylase